MKSYAGIDPATVEPLSFEPPPETPKPNRRWLTCGVVVGFVWLLCAGLAPWLSGLWEPPLRLLFGWAPFLRRTLPEVSVSPIGVVTFALLLAGLAAAVHSLGRWGLPGSDGHRGWGVRATAATCGLIVSLFVAGVAATGAGHQIGWLTRTPLTDADGPARTSQSQNNLKQIGLALHNYHSQHEQFPPGGTFGPAGGGQHGWATRVLPFLDKGALFQRVTWNEPWSAPVNRLPFAEPVESLLSPDRDLPTEDADGYALAHYAGNSRMLTDGDGSSIRDARDGTVNTLLAGEVADRLLPWAHPANTRDPAVGLNAPGGFGGPWEDGGAHVVMVDGSVHFLNADIDPAVLRALATPDGGEEIDPLY